MNDLSRQYIYWHVSIATLNSCLIINLTYLFLTKLARIQSHQHLEMLIIAPTPLDDDDSTISINIHITTHPKLFRMGKAKHFGRKPCLSLVGGTTTTAHPTAKTTTNHPNTPPATTTRKQPTPTSANLKLWPLSTPTTSVASTDSTRRSTTHHHPTQGLPPPPTTPPKSTTSKATSQTRSSSVYEDRALAS